MAPTLRTEGSDHRATLRFGNGAEFGITRDRPLALSIAGQPVTGREARGLSGPRAGVSTLALVAIGTGVVLVVGTLLFVDALNDASEWAVAVDKRRPQADSGSDGSRRTLSGQA